MNDFTALINGLHGFSIAIGLVLGLVGGFVFAMLTYRFYGKNFRNTFERLSDEMKVAYKGLASEALASSQQELVSLADRELGKKTEQHTTELESKKELIDQQLASMSKSMTDTLNTVPTELEKNQKNVSEVIDKSTKSLTESNKLHLAQLNEKSEAQTEKHGERLDSREKQINERLTKMDEKLGEVQVLIKEFEKARERKLGALDDQLKSLTTTTSSLQKALADNRARGQWGERMAEDMLKFMGLVEGVNYIKQETLENDSRPDFTIRVPNDKTLNMDVKFPLENYTRYFDADNDADKKRFGRQFIRDVVSRINEIQRRGYISPDTLDCVLVFIPNEQIYRFIHEQDQHVIDNALRQKVILCSPLTLYVVLAVIWQAAQNFNIERRSRDIIAVVNSIRQEWSEYTKEMNTLEKHIRNAHNKINSLTGEDRLALEKSFGRIDDLMDTANSDDDDQLKSPPIPALREPSPPIDDVPF